MINLERFVELAERLGKVATLLSNLALSICLLMMVYLFF